LTNVLQRFQRICQRKIALKDMMLTMMMMMMKMVDDQLSQSEQRETKSSSMSAQKVLFFWGHDERKCGVKACFSNWYGSSPFVDAQGRKFGERVG
jgi:hypothetical protein